MSDLFLKPEVIWFFAGLLMLAAELATPGFIIIFFGFGAWGVALICLFFDISFDAQLSIFLALSIILLFLLRKKLSAIFSGSRQEASDGEIDDIIGGKAVVSSDIIPVSGGKVNFRGAYWDADSDFEIKKGEVVIITGRKSIRLIVKPFKKEELT
ncbi:MAG: NfeD family protein [Desulforegulaceae bacterium]|nr:NfeD family protein [Desulforegulaceae bacterium]